MEKEEKIFACNLAAMDKDQRARYAILIKQLFSAKREARELADGFATDFAANPQMPPSLSLASVYAARSKVCISGLKAQTA